MLSASIFITDGDKRHKLFQVTRNATNLAYTCPTVAKSEQKHPLTNLKEVETLVDLKAEVRMADFLASSPASRVSASEGIVVDIPSEQLGDRFHAGLVLVQPGMYQHILRADGDLLAQKTGGVTLLLNSIEPWVALYVCSTAWRGQSRHVVSANKKDCLYCRMAVGHQHYFEAQTVRNTLGF